MTRLLAGLVLMLACVVASGQEIAQRIVAAARSQVGVTVGYDGRYRVIAFPGGDVPLDTGVCTDVIVRAFRHVGVDLQLLVHEDMTRAWSAYPRRWSLRKPDSNIDHRRVPNLATFFARQGLTLRPSSRAADYRPGDLVTWELPGGLPHIGIVSTRTSAGVPLVIHNIGQGAREDDMLFRYPITGHYRYPRYSGPVSRPG